jgi:hypothetical protein
MWTKGFITEKSMTQRIRTRFVFALVSSSPERLLRSSLVGYHIERTAS